MARPGSTTSPSATPHGRPWPAPCAGSSQADYPIDGASDHAVSEALYLHDPDGNGIELYWDRPREEWPTGVDGSIAMTVDPLDLDGLLAEADADERRDTPGR